MTATPRVVSRVAISAILRSLKLRRIYRNNKKFISFNSVYDWSRHDMLSVAIKSLTFDHSKFDFSGDLCTLCAVWVDWDSVIVSTECTIDKKQVCVTFPLYDPGCFRHAADAVCGYITDYIAERDKILVGSKVWLEWVVDMQRNCEYFNPSDHIPFHMNVYR